MKRAIEMSAVVLMGITLGVAAVGSPAVATVEQTAIWNTSILDQPDPEPIAPVVSVQRVDSNYVLLPQVHVAPSMGRTFIWQINDNGTWEDFMSTRSYGTKVYDTVNPEEGYKAPSEEGIQEFRLYSPATKYDKEFISRTVRVAYQDSLRWQPLRNKVKDIIKDYCPEPVVEVNAPFQDGLTDLTGLYVSDSAGGTLYIMEGVNESTPDQLIDTSLHECAHSIQDKVARANGMNMSTLDAYLQPIYGPFSADRLAENPSLADLQSAVEQNAQCMTYLMGGPFTWHSYIDRNECTGNKESAARAILEGSLP